MSGRHRSERVDSLFAQLDAIEQAIAENQQELLQALDNPYSATGLGELRAFGEALEQAADELVSAIREQVEASNARVLFARPAKPAVDDATPVDIGL